MGSRVRITFYDRAGYVDFPTGPEDYREFLAAAKNLAARRTDVASHYRLDIADDRVAVIAIAEIQAVIFIEEPADAENGATVAGHEMTEGAALYLKGRAEPVILRTRRAGPLGEMVSELTSSSYGEHDMGCVMLADGDDNPVFLVLDELQYAVISRELLDA